MDSECLEDSEYFDNSGVLWIFPFPLRILSEALCSHSVRFTLALDLTEILSQPILQKFGNFVFLRPRHIIKTEIYNFEIHS